MIRTIYFTILLFSFCYLPIKAADNTVKFPGVEIDMTKQEIRVDAEVSNELLWGEPILEFILLRGRERAYEALFLTDVDPAHIQLGLLMFKLKPKQLPKDILNGTAKEIPADMPPLVEAFVEWDAKGGTKRAPVENFLTNRRVSQKALPMSFAFTGSYFVKNDEGKNVLAASLDGAVLALLYRPAALCNLPYPELTPYNEHAPGGFHVIIKDLPKEFTTTKVVEIADKNGVPRKVKKVITKPTKIKVIIRPTRTKSAEDPYKEILKEMLKNKKSTPQK